MAISPELKALIEQNDMMRRVLPKRGDQLQATPRNIVTGTYADLLQPATNNIVGDILLGDIQRGLNSASYGQPLTTGGSFQTGGIRPEYLALALGLTPMGKGAKAAKKTTFEVAQETAQRNASLPVSEGGLGLPKTNTAMDRAKAMGFDTQNVLYHGTGYDDINQFIPSKGGEYGPGVYFAENPNMANYFSSVSKGEAKNIIPTITNANEILYTSDKNIPRGLGNKGLKKKGYESVVGTGLTGETQRTVLDPAQIRSINAAFDPFRRNEADILAGVAAAPVGLLTVDKEKTKKKRSNK